MIKRGKRHIPGMSLPIVIPPRLHLGSLFKFLIVITSEFPGSGTWSIQWYTHHNFSKKLQGKYKWPERSEMELHGTGAKCIWGWRGGVGVGVSSPGVAWYRSGLGQASQMRERTPRPQWVIASAGRERIRESRGTSVEEICFLFPFHSQPRFHTAHLLFPLHYSKGKKIN